MKNYLSKFAYTSVAFFIASATHAFEEHGAHEHGHATLALVQENNELQLLLTSPAMNIVGFEHAPSTDEHHAKIDAAAKLLKDHNQIFSISTEAGCALEHAEVRSELLEASYKDDHDEHHHEEEHHEEKHHDKDHHDEHHAEHDHDHEAKHNDHEHGDHHDKEHHDNHDSEEGWAHSEFEAEYHYECSDIAALSEIKVNLFESFGSIGELEVQVVMESGQKLIELSPGNSSIKL